MVGAKMVTAAATGALSPMAVVNTGLQAYGLHKQIQHQQGVKRKLEEHNNQHDQLKDQCQAQFADHESKLAKHESKFADHESKLSGLDLKNADQEAQIANHESKHVKHESKFADHESKFADHNSKVAEYESRIAALEANANKKRKTVYASDLESNKALIFQCIPLDEHGEQLQSGEEHRNLAHRVKVVRYSVTGKSSATVTRHSPDAPWTPGCQKVLNHVWAKWPANQKFDKRVAQKDPEYRTLIVAAKHEWQKLKEARAASLLSSSASSASAQATP
jgi:hypothetical protein